LVYCSVCLVDVDVVNPDLFPNPISPLVELQFSIPSLAELPLEIKSQQLFNICLLHSPLFWCIVAFIKLSLMPVVVFSNT